MFKFYKAEVEQQLDKKIKVVDLMVEVEFYDKYDETLLKGPFVITLKNVEL